MTATPSPIESLSPPQIARFGRLAECLREAGRTLNLTAIQDPEAVRIRHFEDSLAACPLLRERLARRGALRIVDIGSGAGFPGLALAIALPECQIVSIEATGKKARFQEAAAASIGLDNFTVRCARAEDLARDPGCRSAFDAATARAVAALPLLAEWAFPFLRVGGCAIAWKGPGADAEIQAARRALPLLGGGTLAQHPYALPVPGDPDAPPARFRLILLEKTKETPSLYPRPLSVIRKTPLA